VEPSDLHGGFWLLRFGGFWLLRFPVVVVVAGGKELFVSWLFFVGNNDKEE
jgi:hypothetical protein